MSDSDATSKEHVGALFVMSPDDPFVIIVMGGCGTTFSYRVNEIPMHDVPCPCGDPKHWLVKWEAPK